MVCNDFAMLARHVFDLHYDADKNDRSWPEWSDRFVMIRLNFNGLDMEVSKLAVPEMGSRWEHENPVTMVVDNTVIRNHGEHICLIGHLMSLISEPDTGKAYEFYSEMLKKHPNINTASLNTTYKSSVALEKLKTALMDVA